MSTRPVGGQSFVVGLQHPYQAPRGRARACCPEPPFAEVHDMRIEVTTRMTCAEANCSAYLMGWVTPLDPENDVHAGALRWLHGDQGRRFIELRSEEAADWIANHGAAQGVTDSEGKLAALVSRTPPGLLILLFPPGQQCFKVHVDREVEFVHASARGGRYVHERPADFEEDMNETAYRLGVLKQRG